jgi:hypothetical protein
MMDNISIGEKMMMGPKSFLNFCLKKYMGALKIKVP